MLLNQYFTDQKMNIVTFHYQHVLVLAQSNNTVYFVLKVPKKQFYKHMCMSKFVCTSYNPLLNKYPSMSRSISINVKMAITMYCIT